MSQNMLSLPEWTARATAGLPPSAAAKFRAEIADHAAEAGRKHAAEGMSADEAGRAALADLGDAAEVARTFRDAHFSRGEYTRGGLILIAQLLLSLVGMVTFLIATSGSPAAYGADGRLTAINQWNLVWQIVGSLVGVAMSIFVARVFLTWLKEQYEIRVPRWGWWLYVACLLMAIPYGIFYPVMALAQNASTMTAAQFSELALIQSLYHILTVLMMVNIARQLLIGGLLIGFAVRRLAAMRLVWQPALAMLAILIALTGVGALVGGAQLLIGKFILPPDFTYTLSLIGMIDSLSSIFSTLDIVLLVMLLGLFGHMRRPGAVLAV